jgi:hypothetical protein
LQAVASRLYSLIALESSLRVKIRENENRCIMVFTPERPVF